MVSLSVKQKNDWDTSHDCCYEDDSSQYKGGSLADCDVHCKLSKCGGNCTVLTIEIANSTPDYIWVHIEIESNTNNTKISPKDDLKRVDDKSTRQFNFTLTEDGGSIGDTDDLEITIDYTATTKYKDNANRRNSLNINLLPAVSY